MRRLSLTALFALGTLGACTVLPTEPGVLALPGKGKTLEQFQLDEGECRRYAGGRSAAEQGDAYDAQRRYDYAYIQCMYSKGHKVPVAGGYAGAPSGILPPPPGAVAPPGAVMPRPAGTPPDGGAPAPSPEVK